MKLSSDREYLVLENMQFVRYLVSEMGISPKHPDYEDTVSIGTIGLIKAAETFDETQGRKFTSYAGTCIKNEIGMYYRKKDNTSDNKVSMSEPVPGTDGKLTIEGSIMDPKSDFTGEVADRTILVSAVNIILNHFSGKYRLAMLLNMGGMKQKEIADELNCSKANPSKILKKVSEQVLEMLDKHQGTYEIVFSMQSNSYTISFPAEYMELLQNVCPNQVMHGNPSTIMLPADPMAFILVAKIFQEMDETNAKANAADARIKISKKKRIEQYMLKATYFSVKDLEKEFPDINTETIRKIIFKAKQKRIIVSLKRGVYCKY